jgi:hypothetical protein
MSYIAATEISVQEFSMAQGGRRSEIRRSESSEENLIRYMKEAFGYLATLLLTGYGESEVTESRSFIILTDNFGVKTRHWITLRAGDLSGLPSQREPIVLLALLKLTLVGGEGVVGDSIRSPSEAVGGLLGWENSEDTVLTVSSALRKYFHMSYVRTDDIQYTFPERRERLTGMYRLLRYCEFGRLLRTEEERFEGVIAEFSENVISEFFEGRLFRINWRTVTSFIPATEAG